MIEGQGDSSRVSGEGWYVLMDILLPSQSNLAAAVIGHVALALLPLGLSEDRREKLESALAEATAVASSQIQIQNTSLPVGVRVLVSHLPNASELKALDQSVNGWGFFLVEKHITEMDRTAGGAVHMLQIYLYLEGETPFLPGS